MTLKTFDFASTREQLCFLLTQAIENDGSVDFEGRSGHILGNDLEKKLAFDQSFRDVLLKFTVADSDPEVYKKLINHAVDAVKLDLCSSAMPFILLSDVFDMVMLEKCENIFQYVEERVDMWKSELFYSSGKNYLLRMCNDLRSRLSKSQNTVFCGRIHLFLARLFPLSEKSGLNLMSQFNSENLTVYNTKPEDYERMRSQSVEETAAENMDFEEGETDDTSSSIPIDYNLYKKFWALQDFFRKPTQCYEKVPWKTFTDYAEEVVNCFDSFKLDDIKSMRRQLQDGDEVQAKTATYFAKYLTSEKLLDLQLSDSNFRRYVLVQFLILFQYLNANVKFKNPNQILAEEQNNWVKTMTEKIVRILKETPPEGEKFARAIERILSHEENWNGWKNDGCPSFVREKPAPDAATDAATKPSQKGKRRSVGDDLKACGGKVIKMGNNELTRLWNICPDNLEACRDQKRNFIPSLEEFFEEAALQQDPKAMIEEQYKAVNNANFAWKALRLMASKSTFFFTQQPVSQQQRKLSEYLDCMIEKLAKDVQSHGSKVGIAKATPEEGATSTPPAEAGGEEQNGESSVVEKDDDEEEGEEREEGAEQEGRRATVVSISATRMPTGEEEGVEGGRVTVTTDQLRAVAARIGKDWSRLAAELNFPDDDVKFFESETDDQADQATKMLLVWKDNEGDKATIGALLAAMEEVGQASLVTDIFGLNLS